MILKVGDLGDIFSAILANPSTNSINVISKCSAEFNSSGYNCIDYKNMSYISYSDTCLSKRSDKKNRFLKSYSELNFSGLIAFLNVN